MRDLAKTALSIPGILPGRSRLLAFSLRSFFPSNQSGPSACPSPSRRQVTQAAVLICATAVGFRAVCTQATSGFKESNMLESWANVLGANRDNTDLVLELVQFGRIKSRAVAQTMRKVDRKFFIKPDMPALQAYSGAHCTVQDQALPIGYGQTISAPHMHAAALELLEDQLHPGASVLDVGSGSGYLSACMGLMVGDTGHVLGIERHPSLAKRSEINLRRALPELAEKGTVRLEAGNALDHPAVKEHGPFDVIHVGAAASDLPQVLVDQLKPGGRMIVPIGEQNDLQVLKCIDKDPEGNVTSKDMMGVLFVPLRDSTVTSSDSPHHDESEL